jgi:hypothetical protein
LNNLNDGRNQDAVDVFLGVARPGQAGASAALRAARAELTIPGFVLALLALVAFIAVLATAVMAGLGGEDGSGSTLGRLRAGLLLGCAVAALAMGALAKGAGGAKAVGRALATRPHFVALPPWAYRPRVKGLAAKGAAGAAAAGKDR